MCPLRMCSLLQCVLTRRAAVPALPATAGNQTSKFYRLVRVSAYTHKHTHTHNTHITHITHTHTHGVYACVFEQTHTYIHTCMHAYVRGIHTSLQLRAYVRYDIHTTQQWIQHNNGYVHTYKHLHTEYITYTHSHTMHTHSHTR
jgi:hypothetical protein